MTRILLIVGLLLTTFATILLMRFPPIAMTWTADGSVLTRFRWSRAAIIAIALFLAGFVLTLIGIIRS
jgi:uncharacterized membrane protein (DUF485 family)